MSIPSIGPSFGCSGSPNAKFGAGKIDAEMSDQIKMLQYAVQQRQAEAKELKAKSDSWTGGEELLQAGLLTSGGIAALFGFGGTAAALLAYPFIKGLVNYRNRLDK